MSNLFKKIFFGYMVLAMAVLGLGGIITPAHATTYYTYDQVIAKVNAGQLANIQQAGSAGIYNVYKNSDGTFGKLPIDSGFIYKAWFADDYSDRLIMTATEFKKIAVGIGVFALKARPGSLIAFYDANSTVDNNVYAVDTNYQLHLVSDAVGAALYGSNWKTKSDTMGGIQHVRYQNAASYSVGTPLTNMLPDGTLVSNGGNYYVISGTTLRQVTTAGLTGNSFDTARAVALASTGAYTTGTQVTGLEAGLWNFATTATTPVVPSTGSVTVGLASDNPAAAIVASGTAFNPALKLMFNGGSTGGNITSLTVSKTGLVANTLITGIDVVDGAGVRHGNVVTSINTDNTINFLFATPISVPAGGTQTALVRFNSSSTTGTIQLGVVSASGIGGVTASGQFPLWGNTMSLQDGSASVGSLVVGTQIVVGNSNPNNLNVDPINEQDITKFTLLQSNSKEALNLYGLTLYNYGNAAATDYKDVQLVDPNLNVLATAQPSGNNVVFNLDTPYFIDKGLSKTLTVRAKIIGGSSRTIQFAIYNDYDVMVKGATVGAFVLPTTTMGGAGITPGDTPAGTSFPLGNGAYYNKVTIAPGTITFAKDQTSPTSAVTPGTNNVVLGTFYAKPNGENMQLQKVSLGIVKGGSHDLTGSVIIKVNGAAVYSGDVTSIANSATSLTTISLNSYPILTAGVNALITVEANVSSNATAADSYQAYMNLIETKRLITNDIYTPTTGISSANNIAVNAGGLTVTTEGVPVSASVVAGTSQFELARFELNANTSGEDVRIAQATIFDSGTIPLTVTTSTITNLTLYKLDGSTLTPLALSNTGVSTLTAASTTFSFAQQFVVTRGNPVVLVLKGDITGGNRGTVIFSMNAGAITASGVSTGNPITGITYSGTGPTMTVAGSGTMTLSMVSGTGGAPTISQLVPAGTHGGTYFAFTIGAQNEAFKLQHLTLTASSTAGATALNLNDIRNIQLFRNNDTIPFATASQLTGSAGLYNYTWTATDNLLKDSNNVSAPVQPGSPVTITVKADLGDKGQAVLGDNFVFEILTPSTDVAGKGSSSNSAVAGTGSAIAASGTTFISPFSVVATGEYPTVSGQQITINGGTVLGRFKVTNNGTAPISLTNVKINDNGSNSTTTAVYNLFFSDDGQSNYLGNGTAAASSTESSHVLDFNTGGGYNAVTINGGSFRYLTVTLKTTNAGLVTGDSFSLAISSLGNLKYSLVESSWGYDGNANGSLADTSTGLYVDGLPSVGTFTKL